MQDGESIKAMGVDTDLRWLPFIAKATPASQIPPATGRKGLLYCASLNPIAAAAVEFLVEEVVCSNNKKKKVHAILIFVAYNTLHHRMARQQLAQSEPGILTVIVVMGGFCNMRTQVLPLLPPELQHLVIVGPYWRENLPNLPKLEQSSYLEFTGPVSDDELQTYYDTKRVFVAPLLESTGIATKIINAMFVPLANPLSLLL